MFCLYPNDYITIHCCYCLRNPTIKLTICLSLYIPLFKATDVPTQSPRTPNPSSNLRLLGEKWEGGVSPAVGSPDNRQSTKKPGFNVQTPPSMKMGETEKEMFFEEEGGIEVVAGGMESLTAADDVETNLTSSVSPSCIISSIDDLEYGDLIKVKSGECKWEHARVTDVEVGFNTIERYVKFDGDGKFEPLKNYSSTDIRRRAPLSPSRRLSNAAASTRHAQAFTPQQMPTTYSSYQPDQSPDTSPNKVAMQTETSPLKPEQLLKNDDITDNKAGDTVAAANETEDDAQLDVIAEEDTAEIRETTKALM